MEIVEVISPSGRQHLVSIRKKLGKCTKCFDESNLHFLQPFSQQGSVDFLDEPRFVYIRV